MSTRVRATCTALAVGIAVAASIPSLSGAQGSGARDITVLEKIQGATFVHHNPKTSPRSERLATGDRVVTRQALFDANRNPTGTLFTDCVNVGKPATVFKATLQCTSTYRFGDGQVVAAGVVRLQDSAGVVFPIVGGSGAYRGASGEITAGQPVDGFQGADVLHLDG